jgi:methylated-DNA-[protein]-cysteine S-methyltransferase
MEITRGLNAMFYTFIESPLGDLLAVSDGKNLIGLYMEKRELSEGEPTPSAFTSKSKFKDALLRGSAAERNDFAEPFAETKEQLNEYFHGNRNGFDLPLLMRGTDFQKQVWAELLNIPYGTTISYGELASRIGNAKGSRAVGLANGRNPISVIVPCHRVIGSNGSLTGYGGGLANKLTLLRLEKADAVKSYQLQLELAT